MQVRPEDAARMGSAPPVAAGGPYVLTRLAGGGRLGGRAPVSIVPETRLHLLGGFELVVGRRSIDLPLATRRLLAYLAVRERPATRSHLAGTLWPDVAEDRAMACLRSALWRLRRVGGRVSAAHADLLALDGGVSVDLFEVYRLACDLIDRSAAHEADPDADVAAIAPLARAGDLLPDWDDDWVLSGRERLRQVRLHALEALSERLVQAGRYGRAVEAALASIEADPLRESARRSLIRAHLAEGNVFEAIAQYRTYRGLLHDELGIEPSPQLEELIRPLG